MKMIVAMKGYPLEALETFQLTVVVVFLELSFLFQNLMIMTWILKDWSVQAKHVVMVSLMK